MVQVPKARCIVQNSQEVSDICATCAADAAIVLVLIGAERAAEASVYSGW